MPTIAGPDDPRVAEHRGLVLFEPAGGFPPMPILPTPAWTMSAWILLHTAGRREVRRPRTPAPRARTTTPPAPELPTPW